MSNESAVPAALWMAVLEAQRSLRAVTKDKTAKVVTKGGASYEYKFASTEDVMAAAREALLGQGVIAQRTGYEIHIGEAGPEVLSTFRLVHAETGQVEVYPAVPMPIAGQGAADKVLAGALTYSWSYWLRDVLAIPRADDHDPDRRTNDDGASRFGKGARPEHRPPQRAPEPEPQADPIWEAYEEARDAYAQRRGGITTAKAHAEIREAAGVTYDDQPTDAQVQAMTAAAKRLPPPESEPPVDPEPAAKTRGKGKASKPPTDVAAVEAQAHWLAAAAALINFRVADYQEANGEEPPKALVDGFRKDAMGISERSIGVEPGHFPKATGTAEQYGLATSQLREALEMRQSAAGGGA
jgi:hypothetical protein